MNVEVVKEPKTNNDRKLEGSSFFIIFRTNQYLGDFIWTVRLVPWTAVPDNQEARDDPFSPAT